MQLAQDPDENLSGFARGCLENVQVALAHEATRRLYDSNVRYAASTAIQARFRGRMARKALPMRRLKAESVPRSTLTKTTPTWSLCRSKPPRRRPPSTR